MTKTETAKTGERIAEIRQTAGSIGGALNESGRAYFSGVMALGKTLGGFGQEILKETGEHVRATVKAKNLREVAELQASWAQHRIEMSATHTKEFVDIARARTEETINPIKNLIRKDVA